MKEKHFFPHDYNPTADPKIVCLIGNYGGVGYGIFWRIVEMLHQEETHKLPKKQFVFEAIAKQMLTSVEQVEAIINQCISNYELLKSDDEFFWSSRVFTNFEIRQDISEKRSKAGKLGVLAKQQQAIAKQNLANVSNIKEKKTIENNNIIAIDSELSSQVQEIMKIFYEINPTLNFGNNSQRKAAERLIQRIGIEKAKGSAQAAIAIHGQPFAPTITTPIQLENKLSELVAFYKKHESKQIIKI